MKALVYTGPKRLDICEMPEPSPGEGELIVRVEAVGICGSDMHAWLGHDERRPAPLVLGHEAAGTVIGGRNGGRRVTINPLIGCGSCAACHSRRHNVCARREIISMPPREGAFAQQVAVPRGNLVAVPDHVSFEQAALVEPIACGWHAVRLARHVLETRTVATRAIVLGGGAIGLGAALVLADAGVRDIAIAEPNARRRLVVEDAGPFEAYDPTGGADPEGGPADLVIDGVGIDATRAAASALAKPGGVIAHIGLGTATGGLDVRRMTLQEITFIGCYTYTPKDFRDTATAIFAGRLGALTWPDIRSLDDGPSAFRQIHAGDVAAPKIVLRPHA